MIPGDSAKAARARKLLQTFVGALSAASLLAACSAATDQDPAGDGALGAVTEEIQRATPAPPSFLLSTVKVLTWRGLCSGTLIATNRVLTAAHCVCTEDLASSNTCRNDVTVEFRPNPTTGAPGPAVAGVATPHPSYNPSWVDRELEHDLAVVALSSPAPSYVSPLVVSDTRPAAGTDVLIAGFGYTGYSCQGPLGTLHYDVARVDRLVDEGRQAQWDDEVTCSGDSGGPVLNTAATRLLGVHSGGPPTVSHGFVSKAVLTQPYYSWIRSLTCASSLYSRCDDNAPMCRCSAGVGDCDTDADCQPSLRCAQNVGAAYGYTSDVDVCIPSSGPPEGTCSCRNSGLSNICVNDENRCSASYVPVCNPTRGVNGTSGCGGCECR